ncbi:hypothetical protein BH23PLA1_BH23PLA1_02750 [soil metagenome]
MAYLQLGPRFCSGFCSLFSALFAALRPLSDEHSRITAIAWIVDRRARSSMGFAGQVPQHPGKWNAQAFAPPIVPFYSAIPEATLFGLLERMACCLKFQQSTGVRLEQNPDVEEEGSSSRDQERSAQADLARQFGGDGERQDQQAHKLESSTERVARHSRCGPSLGGVSSEGPWSSSGRSGRRPGCGCDRRARRPPDVRAGACRMVGRQLAVGRSRTRAGSILIGPTVVTIPAWTGTASPLAAPGVT